MIATKVYFMNDVSTVRYRVTGMDCPSCASKIEKTVRALGVEDVNVSIASQIMTLHLDEPAAQTPGVERAVTDIGYRLDRLDDSGAMSDDCADDILGDKSHLAPAYKNALWIVVVLNVGYGVIELIGGFLAESQSLKADALDFLGDGLITFMGVLAIGWSILWRARSALIQGIFLGILGLGVLGNTTYRVLVQNLPDAELMGLIAFVALIVNVVSALVLAQHRTGDSNVRAVWLFSRNDAIGNVVVIVSAGLVALMNTPWPDLVAAFGIAGLFLHSSWIIIKDATTDLHESKLTGINSTQNRGTIIN